MSAAASRLLVVAAVACAAALGTGLALLGPFRDLLEIGAGAAEGFSSAWLTRVHGQLGHLAALAAVPVAAAGLLLGLHGLLSPGGRRLRSGLLAGLSPLALFGVLGAAYTGHAAWEPTLLGELQPDVLHGFLRTHGALFGSAAAGGLALLAANLAWHRRGRRSEDEDELG